MIAGYTVPFIVLTNFDVFISSLSLSWYSSPLNGTSTIFPVKAENLIANASVLLAQLEISFETVSAFFKVGKKYDILNVLNPAPMPEGGLSDEWLSFIDLITPNESEMKLLVVVVYDDIYMAGILMPELTTVRQPAYEMGYKASELVIKHINHEVINKHDYELKTEFIVRGSTK